MKNKMFQKNLSSKKDSIISGLMKDVNALQEWLTGFCEGKLMDLKTLCTSICTRNCIESVLTKANGNSVYTTISYKYNYNQFYIFLDYSNLLHDVKDLKVQLEESKDYCKKADIRSETVMEYYAEKEQNKIYKEEREQYLEKSNRELKDEVSALHNQVKELDLNYVTRLNKDCEDNQ